MAQGLQFKENLQVISGGYPGEDYGSNGLVQDWTDTTGTSGTSTVSYYYHDSALYDNNNSSKVVVTVTDTWSAQLLNDNTYRITVSSVVNSITRTRVGNPYAYSVSIHVKQTAGGADIWHTTSCDNATTTHTIATNINLGTFSFDLPPESTGSTRGTVYYRNNSCGHDSDVPPSEHIDEYWMGINFRNNLKRDYRPGATYNGSNWMSHNRSSGWAGVWDGPSFKEMRTADGGSGTGNPPLIKHSDAWKNERKTGQE